MRQLVALARPRLLPFVLGLPLAGYGWAHWDRGLEARGIDGILLVLLAWTLLHAGTLWLNAELDRDDGEVLLGRPVEIPRGTGAAGVVALLVAVGLAVPAGTLVAGATVAAALLSVAYSHPRLAWKGHPVLGPLVNVVGYGLLSPFAGWAVVGVAPNLRTLFAWAVVPFGILGSWAVAQAFQGEADRARGYRTWVVLLGPQATLDVARASYAAAWGLGAALAIAGWIPRLILLSLPMAVWVDAHLARWRALPDGGRAAHAVEAGRRLAWAALVVFLLAGVDYVHGGLVGAPPAGLGTAAGRPADVPLPPPWAAPSRALR